MSGVGQVVLVSSVIGAGIGLAYAAMPTLTMVAVPVTDTAAATASTRSCGAIDSFDQRYIGTGSQPGGLASICPECVGVPGAIIRRCS
jgi:hypothetical protein